MTLRNVRRPARTTSRYLASERHHLEVDSLRYARDLRRLLRTVAA